MLCFFERGKRNIPEVGAFREILPDEPVRILVRAALPGRIRIGEIYLYLRLFGEELVFTHLRPAIIGETFPEFHGDAGKCFCKLLSYREGILLLEWHNERESRGTFDQGADSALVILAHDEIAFPMSRNDPAFRFFGALRDAYDISGSGGQPVRGDVSAPAATLA